MAFVILAERTIRFKGDKPKYMTAKKAAATFLAGQCWSEEISEAQIIFDPAVVQDILRRVHRDVKTLGILGRFNYSAQEV